jgi:peptide chain release factor 2
MSFSQQDIDLFLQRANGYLSSISIEEINNNISDLEQKLSEPDIWSNSQLATSTQKQLKLQQNNLLKFTTLKNLCEELDIAGKLNEEDLITQTFKTAQNYLLSLENSTYLDGQFDEKNAILTVHAGAGGIDAEDWAAMILSMYQAFCKNQDWKYSIIDLSAGSEGGIKTASLKVEGEYCYGLLKEEFGVHRLVRLSPFNSAHTRETSFCLVEVMPLDIEVENKITLEEKDLKWDYYMAGGHGGQSVNTTYSAVRVTHLPTNTVVTCQNERSQVQNKQMALKYLSNKLAIIQASQQEELKQSLRGSWQSAQWSNQIRNYVLHPYKLVKDLRSNWETSNIDDVLIKGNIIEIIWSVKRKLKSN